MQKLVFVVLAIAVAVGFLMPGKPSTPAATAASMGAPGLFEAPPYKVTQLERKADGHFYVTAEVNGAPVHFLVDTGATPVALTQDDARSIGLDFSSSDFEPIAQTANGVARGKAVTLAKVSVEGKDATEVAAVIMEKGGVSLLGQAYLARISGVEMSGEHMILR